MNLSQFDKQFRPVVRAAFLFCVLLLLFEIASKLSQATSAFFSSLDFPAEVRGLLLAVLLFSILNVPLILAERFSPGTTNRRNYLQGATYWLIYIVITYFWSKIAIATIAKLQITPLFTWSIKDNSSNGLIIVAALLLPILVYDFFYYWFHRAQHRFAFLWRFHEVHHSIVHMNCINSYHHVLEEVLRFPCMTIPIALLLKIEAPQIIILSAFIATWGQYIHSDTSIHLGKLGSIVGDNAHHRIHHSIAEQHYDKNFAAFFPVWDRLFGTYHRPVRGRLIPVGLSDKSPPKTAIDYLLMPFRRDCKNVS